MTRRLRHAAPLALTFALTPAVTAWTAAARAQVPAGAPAPAQAASPAVSPSPAQGGQPPAASSEAQPYRRRSIVHHYPYPYPEYYHGDQTAGFRNPGGTGRFLEYYPAGNQFQANVAPGRDPVRVATFGGGGVPDRAEQLAAQQIGIARYNSIQQHIDNYARPSFGVGFFGGFN